MTTDSDKPEIDKAIESCYDSLIDLFIKNNVRPDIAFTAMWEMMVSQVIRCGTPYKDFKKAMGLSVKAAKQDFPT